MNKLNLIIILLGASIFSLACNSAAAPRSMGVPTTTKPGSISNEKEIASVSSAFFKGTQDETGLPPIPQLFVFSPEGRLVEHLIGDRPQRGVEYLEQVVTRYLSGVSK